jgi:hypothetical protein
MTELSEVFWMTVLATAAGVLGLVIKKMASSKCDEISCYGVHIHRRVDFESNDDISEEEKTRQFKV